MSCARLTLLCAVLLMPVLPAHGASDDGPCLSPREMRTRIQTDNLVRPGSVRAALDGDVIGLELCERNKTVVYVVTVLAPNGAVERVWFDARSGRRLRP